MRKEIALLSSLLLFLFACDKSIKIKEEDIHVSSVSVTPSSSSLIIGETVQLRATVLPEDATNKTVVWSSLGSEVATVSNSGLVTAKAEGTTIIEATADGKSGTCAITVKKEHVAVSVAVSSVELSFDYLELIEGDSKTITAAVKPDDATDKTVTWSTSDASVATVENGIITAIKEGTATITAKAGDKSAECRVTVAKKVITVASVELNKTSLELVEGDSETLTATVKPDDATDKTITWSTSSAEIAAVDATGKVTAVAEGSATITAAAGSQMAACEVVVKPKTVPEGAVDLGLCVYWAECNLGAVTPKEYGDYYAWGETEAKGNYTEKTYKWYEGNKLTKYNLYSDFGTVDNKTVLDESDDVAHMKLGGNWRMPTLSECTELRTKCTWTWTTQGGNNGYEVTGMNGNSIFLPAAGGRYNTSLYNDEAGGFYWSSSLTADYPDDGSGKIYDTRGAYGLAFNSEEVRKFCESRIIGCSVRPVSK